MYFCTVYCIVLYGFSVSHKPSHNGARTGRHILFVKSARTHFTFTCGTYSRSRIFRFTSTRYSVHVDCTRARSCTVLRVQCSVLLVTHVRGASLRSGDLSASGEERGEERQRAKSEVRRSVSVGDAQRRYATSSFSKHAYKSTAAPLTTCCSYSFVRLATNERTDGLLFHI